MYLLTQLLTIGSFIDTMGEQIFLALISCGVCIFSGYIFVREKVLKNELKTEQVTQYIDTKVEVLENKIMEIQSDIIDFKEINKETSKSLTENTAAMRELKSVLNMLKEQLNHERSLRNRKYKEDNEE